MMNAESNARAIYERLRAAGMSHAGACGMIGNFEAESSLQPNNLQNSYEKKLGFVDELYTAAVDNGSYKNFVNDDAGYGYAQWTFGPRKEKFLEFVNNQGASIGDGDAQVDFAIHELRTEYPGLYLFLCTTDDLYTATSRICKEYERPAVDNIDARYTYAQKWFKQFAAKVDTPTAEKPGAWFPPDLSILVLQAVLVGNGYNTEITGYKNEDFYAKLREFVKDIGG